jgi:hypothetical protein
MRKIIGLITVSLVLVSCGSSSKKEEPTPDALRQIELDYKLQETSTGRAKQPEWIQTPKLGDKEGSSRDFRYFISESESASKRLALQSAKARATASIAQEIVSFIKNSYGEATQGGEGEEITEYKEEQLAKETQTFIHGAEVVTSFWEKRRYLKEMGATKDATLYKAFALMRIKKDILNKAVDRASKKFLGDIDNPEVKDKASKAIEEAKDAFTNVN